MLYEKVIKSQRKFLKSHVLMVHTFHKYILLFIPYKLNNIEINDCNWTKSILIIKFDIGIHLHWFIIIVFLQSLQYNNIQFIKLNEIKKKAGKVMNLVFLSLRSSNKIIVMDS